MSLEFADGASAVVDFAAVLAGRPGFYAGALRPDTFGRFEVDDGILTWPNGLDLDPVVLYCRATGRDLTEFLPDDLDAANGRAPTRGGRDRRG